MKKISILLLLIFITSCSTSGRVCGGSGGKRCVQVTTKHFSGKIS